MDSIAGLIADVRAVIYYVIVTTSGMAGAWFALMGAVHWQESASGSGDVLPRQYFSEILFGAVLLSITSLFAATGGETFAATANTSGYAVLSAGLGDATTTAAANSALNSMFALCSALGWLAQMSAVLKAREVARGKDDTPVTRLIGLLLVGSVLADMSTFVTAVDASAQSGIFGG